MHRGDVVLIADRAGGDYGGKPRPAVIVQSDVFDGTHSLVVCPLTTEARDAPLLRVAVQPSPTLRLAAPSWVMVEKITSVRRDRARAILGRLSGPEMVALGQSLAVLLGFG
ncbi:MAG: type II toxin-antitoxin system PemK/MazF family toxin [Acidibrevibacterium sp.]|uniref:type II toxin-antitoxin system PemK/MazF family toxin n=1 Tax=Acidibrevibacterium sp. TaxID=2606776 RepID=UPI003D030468